MGIRSMTISASGVFTDAASETTTRTTAFSGDSVNYDLVLEILQLQKVLL